VISNFEKSREIWRKILAIRGISGTWDILSLNLQLGLSSSSEVNFERYLQFLDRDEKSKIQRLLTNRRKALIYGKKPTSTLKQRLQELELSYRKSLAEIPRSLDKAKGSLMALIDIGDFETDQEYDGLCLLREHVSSDIISRIVTRWKEELRFSLSEREKAFLPQSYIFWSSNLFMETIDAICRYHFMEVFNVGDFPETIAEIESMFAYALMGPYPNPIWTKEDPEWASVAYNLWLASRSPRLCGRIRHFIEIALTRVVNHQHKEGWWPLHMTRQVAGLHEQYLPSNHMTALSCVDLLRLSRNNRQLEHVEQGIQWLVKQQSPDGAWTDTQIYGQKIVQKPDLFTTLLAVDAIKESGLTGYDYTVSKADSWIMNQQGLDGTWRDEVFPFPFMTILVVEYFERRRPPLSKLESYLSIARDFILRSQELALEDSENSWRLAIVVAFQGIEAFLYACLSHHSVNIGIFEKRKPNRTIGMRRALDELEKHLQRKGTLSRGQLIEYRNSLGRLAYYRDEIVHKGAFVPKKEALELTEVSARFCELICQRIFGYSLL